MKLQGHELIGPNEEILVLQRNGKDLVFTARAVLDYTEFDGLVPKPQPKKVNLPGGEIKILWDDKAFVAAFDHYGNLHTAYTVLKSLEATPDLTWDTIDKSNPSTWLHYKDELKAAFFSDREIIKIVNLVWVANNLDESKLDEARKRFLATREQVQEPQT